MLHGRPLLLAALLLAAPAAPAVAAPGDEPPAAAAPALPDTSWTVDDVVLAESAREWTLARDGSLAAWVKSTVEKVDGEQKRVANLMLSRLGGQGAGKADAEPLPLTRGRDHVSSPAFSPDGRHLAFLSDHALPGGGDHDAGDDDAKTQLWAIDLAGGEPYPLTRFDRDVRAFAWVDDSTLVALAAEAKSAYERRREDGKDDAVVVDDAAHEPPVRLYRVPLAGDVARLTDNAGWFDALAVSPDGKWAVIDEQVSLSYEFDGLHPPRTLLVDLAAGTTTPLFTDGKLLPTAVRWAPDSSGFYLTNEHSSHPLYRTATVTELYFRHLASGVTTRIDLGDRGLGDDFAPTADGVIALVADGVHLRPARFLRPGGAAGDGSGSWRRQELTGTHAAHLDGWTLAADGVTLVYQTSTATTPPQVFAARLDGARIAGERQLTRLNPGYRDKPTGRVEVVHWKGARGDEVEGLLQYPLDWREGERRPLILAIHGGPTSQDRDSWSQRWPTPTLLWRQRGAFVLQVNYHGSTGYGLAWAESIEGHYYELEIPDIEAGVDAAIARGLVDPERLASAGWSNGGILTAELITRTHRYRAASVGAADVEWLSDWANVDFGATFDDYYFGGAPWERPDVYLAKSPFLRLADVTTPTIVYTGTVDRNVPPHQSWSLFRALQQIGKTDVRFVVFPGQPHSLGKIAFQRRKVEEDLAWFDRYLFARPAASDESIPKGSPLAALLARASAARRGAAVGAEAGGALVPEAVPFHGLRVGRFEVTRAQWAAFDPATPAAPGEENLPVTGVSFARAQEFAAWLTRSTGQPWRLPTVAEAKALADAAANGGTGGNTLDRWVGFPPNPDDRARIATALAAAAERLSTQAPLLLPVGSLPGAGDDPVFDLDGNAAEWAVGDGGAGVATGPSADRSAGARGGDADPAPAYVGLRVVLGGNGTAGAAL